MAEVDPSKLSWNVNMINPENGNIMSQGFKSVVEALAFIETYLGFGWEVETIYESEAITLEELRNGLA